MRHRLGQVEQDVVGEDHRDPDDEAGELAVAGDAQAERHADDGEDEAGGREGEPLLDRLHLLVRRAAVRQLVVGLLPQLGDGQLVHAAQQLGTAENTLFGSSLTISCSVNR